MAILMYMWDMSILKDREDMDIQMEMVDMAILMKVGT